MCHHRAQPYIHSLPTPLPLPTPFPGGGVQSPRKDYHRICPPLRCTDDSRIPPKHADAQRLPPSRPSPWELGRCGPLGKATRPLVYRYVWRDDTSVASDESVRVRVSVGRQSVCLVRATVELFPTR